jgi:hypothetical protein
MTIVDLNGSRNKLTQNMYRIWNVISSDIKVNKTPYNMTITSRILKKLTISGCKVNIELHGSLSSLVISKRSSIEKILETKIRHKKLITKTSLNKSNVLRVITSDDHVIHIKKEKSPTTRWHVDKRIWIMSTGGKINSHDHRGKTLKPSVRSLLKAIKSAMNVINHTLRDRIPRW